MDLSLMKPLKAQTSPALSALGGASGGGSGACRSDEERCDLCGAPVISLHCKLICTRCGYKRDCSDP